MIRFDRATVARAGHVVVEELSLRVLPGQSTALIGRSGAGKSATLAAAACILPLHAGDIVVDGRSARREPDAVRRAIGYVPARLPVWPGVRVDEFVELWAAEGGLRGEPLRAAIDQALALAGLDHRAHEPLEALADGHAKRLLVARALVHDPHVLLFDGPFGGLDPVERRELEQLVADAHLMGRTVLAAVDDGDVPACFTHLAVLREGRLVAEGPADPAAFGGDRRFRSRITSRGRAEDTVRSVQGLAVEARAVDLDHVEAMFEPATLPASRLVAAVVTAGIPVDAAGFHPAWTAQLVE
ncbi:MAG: ATP-binding cassette domain-containing protein [Planctomycetaceae bacterium]